MDGFVKRTGPLIFAIFKPGRAYLIDAGAHRDFEREQLIRIIIETWPDDGLAFELKGILGGARAYTDEERAGLRAAGLSSFVQIDGRIFATAGGISSAGTTDKASQAVPKLQPVFAGDVATAIALAVEGKATPGTTYELGGPEVATLRQINAFVLKVTGRRRWLVPVSFPRAKLLASITETATKLSLGLFPEMFRITKDQVELLHSDNIVSALAVAEGRTLRGLGIAPEPFETFVPSYLYRYRKTGQFAGTRAF